MHVERIIRKGNASPVRANMLEVGAVRRRRASGSLGSPTVLGYR